jgi:hypothetical protein
VPAQYPDEHLLQSWKEISSYLRRSIRTVQRWQSLGLPVRRLGAGRRAPVVADTRDLDRWLAKAELHGFAIPQPAQHLIFRRQLSDSVVQSHQLHAEMKLLRDRARASLESLVATLADVEKTCLASTSHRGQIVSALPHAGGGN